MPDSADIIDDLDETPFCYSFEQDYYDETGEEDDDDAAGE